MREAKIISFKKFYWSIRPEFREWTRTFVFSIPGKTGEFFRRRYAQKHFKKCGMGVKMYPHVRIYNPGNLEIGNRVVFADYVQISAGGGVKIGDHVGMGPYAKIWSINHKIDDITTPIIDQGWTTEEIVIEEDVWIGMGAVILPGAHIGKGSVISTGSVVGKRKIKPYSLIAGNPGRIIGNRKVEKKKADEEAK